MITADPKNLLIQKIIYFCLPLFPFLAHIITDFGSNSYVSPVGNFPTEIKKLKYKKWETQQMIVNIRGDSSILNEHT